MPDILQEFWYGCRQLWRARGFTFIDDGVFVTTVSSRLIQNNIVRMMPNQLASWTAVPLIVLLTGILAGYVPARRAARVDPNVALREL